MSFPSPFSLAHFQAHLNDKCNTWYYLCPSALKDYVEVRILYLRPTSWYSEGFVQHIGPIIGTYPVPTNTHELEVVTEEIFLATLFEGEHSD